MSTTKKRRLRSGTPRWVRRLRDELLRQLPENEACRWEAKFVWQLRDCQPKDYQRMYHLLMSWALSKDSPAAAGNLHDSVGSVIATIREHHDSAAAGTAVPEQEWHVAWSYVWPLAWSATLDGRPPFAQAAANAAVWASPVQVPVDEAAKDKWHGVPFSERVFKAMSWVVRVATRSGESKSRAWGAVASAMLNLCRSEDTARLNTI